MTDEEQKKRGISNMDREFYEKYRENKMPYINKEAASEVEAGMYNQPERLKRLAGEAWDYAKEKGGNFWSQLIAKPDYGAGLRETPKYKKYASP